MGSSVCRIVVPNGVIREAKIYDREGRDLTKLLAIEIGGTIKLDEVVTAQLSIVLVGGDIGAGLVEWRTKNPITGEYEPVSEIRFQSGARVAIDDEGRVTVHEPSAGAS